MGVKVKGTYVPTSLGKYIILPTYVDVGTYNKALSIHSQSTVASRVDRLWGHSVRKHDNQEESTQVTANSNEEFGSTILSRGERLKVWPTHNQGRFRTPRKQHRIKDPSKYERIMNDLYSYGGVPYTLVCILILLISFSHTVLFAPFP